MPTPTRTTITDTAVRMEPIYLQILTARTTTVTSKPGVIWDGMSSADILPIDTTTMAAIATVAPMTISDTKETTTVRDS